MRKYKGVELYLLPLVNFPHKPINTMDNKILKYSNTPLVYPFHKSLNNQLYNYQLSKPHSPSIIQLSRDSPSNPIDEKAFHSHTPLAFPTTKELWSATNNSTCSIEYIHVDPAGLTHLQIQESKHKLFFIKFFPVSTLILC